MKYENALIYASGIVFLTAINAVLVNHFFIAGFHNGMKVRVAICSIIYRKVNSILLFSSEAIVACTNDKWI